jgi:hypothetical protein
MKKELSQKTSGRKIYTLALNRTPRLGSPSRKRIVTVKGNGADLANNEVLQKWAKRKMISAALVLRLIDVAQKKNDSAFIKKCWNTYHCLGTIYTTEGRLHGEYCKNRFCPLCLGIRKADKINRYYPYIQKEWKAPYLVTLTVAAPKAKDLKKIMDGMCRALALIIDKHRRGNKKGKCIKLIGIRSLECGFNEVKRTYNPHFHIIVKNKEIADTLKAEWCKIWTRKYVNPKAQDVTKVWNTKGAFIELIKYCSKIFTDPDKDKMLQTKANPKIYAAAIYNILKAMEKRNVFDTFGFVLPKPKEPKKGKIKIVSDFKEWFFDLRTADYINREIDFPLIGFFKPPDLENLLENCIDTELE